LPSVVALRDWPVARLVAVTVAPEITPPEGSVTVPWSAPVEALCANAGETEMNSAKKQSEITHAIFTAADREPMYPPRMYCAD